MHGHDFEAALKMTIEKWLRCKHYIGCFFYRKHSLHGKLIHMKFDRDVFKEILHMFDFLIVVYKQDIRRGVDKQGQNAAERYQNYA